MITLPFPPSLNNAFINVGRRRVRSRRYTRWQSSAALLAMSTRQPPITEWPVAVSITLHPPCNRKRDADNLIKPLLDALVAAGVLPDDDSWHVGKVEAVWGEVSRAAPRAVITFSQMKRAEPVTSPAQ